MLSLNKDLWSVTTLQEWMSDVIASGKTGFIWNFTSITEKIENFSTWEKSPRRGGFEADTNGDEE